MKNFVFILLLFPLFLSAQADFTTAIPSHFPVPTDENLLFYVQRNRNANTIIYKLNVNEEGSVIKKEPIKVQWRRFADRSQILELSYFERLIGFGVKSQKVKGKPNQFKINFNAYKKVHADLYVHEDGTAEAHFPILDRRVLLEKIYIQADETSWWPRIEFVELWGKDPQTGATVAEKIYP